VKVSGGPYDRGCQHGRACGDLIRRYPGVLLEVISLEGRWRALDRVSAPVKREDLLSRAMTFLPAMEAFAPHLSKKYAASRTAQKCPSRKRYWSTYAPK
jgi:hypothetical protein